MTRPDPSADLVGALRWIMDAIERMEVSEGERVMSARAASLALGYPKSYCHGKPWRVPDFGARGYRHTLSVWREWLAVPENDRRRRWDEMGSRERAKIRGVA